MSGSRGEPTGNIGCLFLRRIPHIRLYDLRYVAATLIIAAGGLEDARRTLGHSSIRLVAETYGFELEGTRAM